MKILVITQYFWPENFSVNNLVYELNKKYKVEVLTTYPSYPHKKFFNKKKNNFNDIKINRVSSFPRKDNKLSIIINHLSFFFSLTFNLFFNKKYREFDLIFVYQPSPIMPILAAGLFKRIYKIPIITWVLDYWPQTIFDLNIVKNSVIKCFLSFQCKKIYQLSDVILAQSKSMTSKIKRDMKITRIKTLYSWSEDHFVKKNINKKKNNKNFEILFSGNIGKAQNLNNLTRAIQLTQNYKNNIKWIFVGDGSEKKWLVNKISALRLKNEFQFYKHRPSHKIPLLYNKVDAGLISLKNGLTFNNTLPAKFQSYIAFGLPIFSFASGETFHLTKKFNLGISCKPNDIAGFATSVIKFSKFTNKKLYKIGKNNQAIYKNNFSKKKALSIIESEIKRLVK